MEFEDREVDTVLTHNDSEFNKAHWASASSILDFGKGQDTISTNYLKDQKVDNRICK